MLVLTRKVGQKLIIDNHIEVTVLETKGDSVKIGVVAPRHIAVYREEIYMEIKRANEQAALMTGQADALAEALQWMKNPPQDPKP